MTDEFLKYVEIKYVPSSTQAEGIPWAVVAVDPASPQSRILIHEIEGCSQWLKDSDRDYLDAILSDWKITLNEHGAPLLDSLTDLGIGPLRTAGSGECKREELASMTRKLAEKTSKGPPAQIP